MTYEYFKQMNDENKKNGILKYRAKIIDDCVWLGSKKYTKKEVIQRVLDKEFCLSNVHILKDFSEFGRLEYRQSEPQVIDIYKVVLYEIMELGNSDILDYALSHYLSRNTPLYEDTLNILDHLDAITEEELRTWLTRLVSLLNKRYNVDIKYVVWLATGKAVKDLYYNAKEVLGFEVSNIKLSDLGYDGCLYCYSEKPSIVTRYNYDV